MKSFPDNPLTGMKQESLVGGDLGDVVGQTFSDAQVTVECGVDEEAAIQQEFLRAAELLSKAELREFVEDHVNTEIKEIRTLPPGQRPQAFRTLCAEWHSDKCPAIAALATDIFQRLQTQKDMVLSS